MRTLFPDQDDIIIIVMGPTGSGKSTFINTIVGKTVCSVGHGLVSCTREVRAFRWKNKSLSRYMVLVDTPGFDDTDLDDTQILALIADWLKQTYSAKMLITALFFLHRITDNRMPQSTLRNLEVFQNLCGQEAFPHVIMVTTMWDSITESQGEAREAQICDGPWREILSHNAKIARFDKTQPSGCNILDQCTYKTVSLLLQKELVDKKLSLPSTSAGRNLFTWVSESFLFMWVQNTIKLLETILKKSKKPSQETSMEIQREIASLKNQLPVQPDQPTPTQADQSPAEGLPPSQDLSFENPHNISQYPTFTQHAVVPPSTGLLRVTADVLETILQCFKSTGIPFVDAPIAVLLYIVNTINEMRQVDKMLQEIIIDSVVLLRILTEQLHGSQYRDKKLLTILQEFVNDLDAMKTIAGQLYSANPLIRFCRTEDGQHHLSRFRQIIDLRFKELGMAALLGAGRDIAYVKGGLEALARDIPRLRQDVKGLNQNIKGLNNEVNGLKENVLTVDHNVCSLRGELNEFRAEVRHCLGRKKFGRLATL